MESIQYRLYEELVVLEQTDSDKPVLSRLQAGQVLYLSDGPRDSGLVNAALPDGRIVTCFHSDLLDRADQMEAAAS